MHRTKVESSNVESVGFDRDAGILEVEYKNKKVYQYPEATADEYAALLAADSKGRFLHQHFVQGGRTATPVEEKRDAKEDD